MRSKLSTERSPSPPINETQPLACHAIARFGLSATACSTIECAPVIFVPEIGQDMPGPGQRKSIVASDRRCPMGKPNALGSHVVRQRHAADRLLRHQRPGRHGVGGAIFRVPLKSLAEKRARLRQRSHPVRQRHAAQIEVVAVEPVGRLLFRPLDLGLLQRRRNQANDAGGDLILQPEHILQRAVEFIRPQMPARRRLDQLAGDANARSRFPHTAFQHIAHAEFAPDLFDIDGAALIGKARIARDHEQRFEPRQRGNDVLHHPVGEIFLLGIA